MNQKAPPVPVPAEPGPLHDVAAVAARLNISTKSVRRMIASGAIPHHRIGKLIRISAADLSEYLAKQRRRPDS